MIVNFNNSKIKFIFFTIILIILFTFQKSNFNTVKASVDIFTSSILPSLFPFILFTNMLLEFDGLHLLKPILKENYNYIFAIIVGFLCGYPMGAKTVSTMLDDKKISHSDALFLLSFINNCNPIFILSTIGLCILNNFKYGLILCISHYMSSIIIFLIYFTHNIIHKNSKISNEFKPKEYKILHKSSFEILDNCIKSSLKILANIFSYITIFNLIFSVINEILQKLNLSKEIIFFLSSLFEVTNGVKMFYLNSNLPINVTLSIISFALGFSGFAIIFQIYACIYKNKIPVLYIIKNKLLQGILSALITFVISNILKNNYTFTLDISKYSYFLFYVCILYILAFAIKKVT